MAQPEAPRTLLSVSGQDAEAFLQNLITQDVGKASNLAYSALLTPQGKFIADFFILAIENGFLLDVATCVAPTLFQRLTMYRLRADVQIVETEGHVSCGTGTIPEGAYADPRHPDLGWRAYGIETPNEPVDWPALRVAHTIPETGIELTPDTYILEAGFETLNGVDFKKGCYVGQEIAARMKHKTELRKGLAKVRIGGQADVGTDIMKDGKVVGTLFTQSGDHAIAYLRYDRAVGPLTAGDATLERV